jgi:predicted component of type VI protein secretion system
VLLWKRWGESSGRPGRDRRRAGMEEAGRVIRAVCSDLKQAVRMRAREMELARAVRESEQAGQSSSRCPDRWALTLLINNSWLRVIYIK